MDQGQLVSEEIDVGAELVRRLDQYVPVKAAFWVKASEEKQWYLYIASDQITDTNRGAAYGQVLRLAGRTRRALLRPVPGQADPHQRSTSPSRPRDPSPVPERVGHSLRRHELRRDGRG